MELYLRQEIFDSGSPATVFDTFITKASSWVEAKPMLIEHWKNLLDKGVLVLAPADEGHMILPSSDSHICLEGALQVFQSESDAVDDLSGVWLASNLMFFPPGTLKDWGTGDYNSAPDLITGTTWDDIEFDNDNLGSEVKALWHLDDISESDRESLQGLADDEFLEMLFKVYANAISA